jgi:alkylation response protein AidB-like acyl-CoA dehydrogenase
MDFALSAQHAEIRRSVRDFAEREIAPVADEMERRGEFPAEIIRKAAGLGLLGVPYPEAVGGTGLDSLAYAITIEELSRVSGSVGIIVSAHTSLGCAPIFMAGTPEQKERYLRPLASGAKLGAYGLTEAGAGSDSRGTRTRAHRDGDAWVLSGSKRFITNAGVADTYIVTAVTDRNADSGKISAFIVEAGTPGFSIGRMEEKMGLHASNTGELLFDDCRIPGDNLLGEEGDGDRLFLKTLDGGRIGIGAMALGLAQAAYEAASSYATQREQFGRQIASFQGVAFKIADMATQIDAARLMVYRAAWLKDRGEPYTTEAAMAKLFASEVARQVTNDAIQVHGGYGYVVEYRVERYLRDAKLTEIGEGTSEIQRLVIARNLLGVRAM